MSVKGQGRSRVQPPQILPLQLLLMGCGMVVLYSNSSLPMLTRHLVWLLLGAAAAGVLWLTPLERIWRLTPLLLVFALLLNLAPHVPGLRLANAGAARWIRLGPVSLQVSEVLKFAMVLYFCRVCAELHETPLKWSRFGVPGAVLALALMLVVLQKDFSTALLMLAVLAVMLFFLSPVLILPATVLATLVTLLVFLGLDQSFRIQRVSDWLGEGSAQINWVHRALERGGWLGIGMGRGEGKFTIPAEMTDFPLSSLGEEAGLLGITAVVVLFYLYCCQGMRLARYCRNPYMRYLCLGFTTLLTLQALANFLVTAGLVPVTGQPLPFYSVGGSSVVMNVAGFGLLNAVRRYLQGGNRA